MANKNTVRRDYIIIKRLQKGDYPTKQELLDCLAARDCIVDPRTLDRDIEHIRSNFDIEVVYDPQRRGYTIDEQSSMDLDKVMYFWELAESSDIIVSSLGEWRQAMRYISISPIQSPQGVQHIKPILEALNAALELTFNHTRYDSGEAVAYRVQPYLLKEFDSRWYLFAYVAELQAFRTFGLDRIDNLTVTDTKFIRSEQLAATAEKFEQIYGLVYEPNQNKNAPMECVRLKVVSWVAKHLSVLPLHATQAIEGDMVSLTVIINPELENKILSFGENVEVLAPASLREKIKVRLTAALKKY
ncbi:MAG: WYL domain-containing protein [Mucinivorans sp.]